MWVCGLHTVSPKIRMHLRLFRLGCCDFCADAELVITVRGLCNLSEKLKNNRADTLIGDEKTVIHHNIT